MLSQTSLPVSKLQHVQTTHRAATLQAIAQKANAIDARIEYLKVQGEKARQALESMPEDLNSRLSWLSQQINT